MMNATFLTLRRIALTASVLTVGVSHSAAVALLPSQELWTQELGNSYSYEYSSGVATDSAGNVYITGQTTGVLDGQYNAGGYDAFLTKYDTSGTKQWTRLLGTSADEDSGAVAVDLFGNIYICGETGGELDGNTNAGWNDIFLTKYDTSGTKLWTKQFGGEDYEAGSSLATDVYGNVYMGGNVADSGSPVDRAFVAKFDSNGNELWTREPGAISEAVNASVALDSLGNVYISGTTDNAIDGNPFAGVKDAFLTKYDASGNKLWTRMLGTSNYDVCRTVTVDADDDVYIGGFTYGEFEGNTNAGSGDAYLAKFNPSGDKLWTQQIGSSGFDDAYSAAADDAGNIYITGITGGDIGGASHIGAIDAFLIMFDQSGTKQWAQVIGSPGEDESNSVTVDTLGNPYITGWSLEGLGDYHGWVNDAFLVKFDLPFIPGDLNGDGFVGLDDLDIILNNWNQTVPPGDVAADASGDGFIGLDDLDIVLDNWNAGTPPILSVPEPTGIVLLLPVIWLCFNRTGQSLC